MTPLPSKDDIRKSTKIISETTPVVAEMLDFYAGLLERRSDTLDRMTEPVTVLHKEDISNRLRQGRALLGKDGFSISTDKVLSYWNEMLDYGAEANETLRQDSERIRQTIDPAMLFTRAAAGKNAITKPLAAQHGVSAEIVHFFAVQTVLPSLIHQAAPYQTLIPEELWQRSRCPVCLSPPDIAYLREEEGFLYYICHHCRFSWRGERIGCPYCGNRDQQKLEYLFLAQQKEVRLNTCQACRRYIKVVDQRLLSRPFVAELEDIGSSPLDYLATEQELRRGVARLFPL